MRTLVTLAGSLTTSVSIRVQHLTQRRHKRRLMLEEPLATRQKVQPSPQALPASFFPRTRAAQPSSAGWTSALGRLASAHTRRQAWRMGLIPLRFVLLTPLAMWTQPRQPSRSLLTPSVHQFRTGLGRVPTLRPLQLRLPSPQLRVAQPLNVAWTQALGLLALHQRHIRA